MGVQADTASAAPGALLFGADGFTAGDAQQGIDPTQVSPTVMNAFCTEINAVICRVGMIASGEYGPINFADVQEMARAIILRMAFQQGDTYAELFSNPAWSRRTFAANLLEVDRNWKTWFRNAALVARPDNSVQVSGHLVVPDESVFWATFEVTVVRSDSILFLKTIILRASCRRTGGSCYVDKLTTVDSFGALGATFDVIATTLSGVPAVAVQTTLPVSAGHTFNIAVSLAGSNVTTGT